MLQYGKSAPSTTMSITTPTPIQDRVSPVPVPVPVPGAKVQAPWAKTQAPGARAEAPGVKAQATGDKAQAPTSDASSTALSPPSGTAMVIPSPSAPSRWTRTRSWGACYPPPRNWRASWDSCLVLRCRRGMRTTITRNLSLARDLLVLLGLAVRVSIPEVQVVPLASAVLVVQGMVPALVPVGSVINLRLAASRARRLTLQVRSGLTRSMRISLRLEQECQVLKGVEK